MGEPDFPITAAGKGGSDVYPLDIWPSRDYVLRREIDLEVKIMAQRRAEKPKKVKISRKQQEFYERFKSAGSWGR